MVWNLIPWNQLVNGVLIGVGASVTEHVAKKTQLPERLIAFGKAVVPEIASLGATAPASPPIVQQAENAASAEAARDATDAKLAEIEAKRRADAAAAEAAAAKARADEAAKAAGDKKHCLCVSSERPWVSVSGASDEGSAGSAGSEINVGCASDHMCDKCTMNHVKEAAKNSPLLAEADLDLIALAVPGEAFAPEPPAMPMPTQDAGKPFDAKEYQRSFDVWSASRQAWEKHQATVGAAADDLAECRRVVSDRGRQSVACTQQLEEARAELEDELKAIAAMQPSVGQAIDAERKRRGLREFFSGLSVGQAPGLSTALGMDLRQCQVTLADLNLKTQACEAELPKVKAAIKVAKAKHRELMASMASTQATLRAAAEKAAIAAQQAKASAEQAASRAAEAVKTAAQTTAQTAKTVVMTQYGPIPFPPQAPAQPAQAAPAPAPVPVISPVQPAPQVQLPQWGLSDDDVTLRFSSEYSSSRGREGDYDGEGEIEEVGKVGMSWPSSDDLFLRSPPSASVFGPGPGPVGCGCSG